MKIAVYGICLNEANNVEGYMACAAEADLVVMADTGSTDGTGERFRALGAQLHDIRILPWRFDDARNAALALVPAEVDVCVSLDLDNRLPSGWRDIVERAFVGPVNQLNYTSLWARTADGAPRRFLDNRIHARSGFRWTGPCHEYLAPVGGPARPATAADLVVEQFMDLEKPRTQYLPLLEMAVAERPDDRRSLHYLGREYAFHGRLAEAVAMFERYLTMPPAMFDAERSATLRLMAECERGRGDAERALRLCHQAAEENPTLRGAWTDLACAHYHAERWEACWAAARQATALPDQAQAYGAEAWSAVLPEDLAAISGWRLGHRREALAFGRAALAKAPGSERIRANVEQMARALGEP
ncbi:tetratricopeptide repeat-containing glycosyltransferase [Caulobacter sp. KR2-114]|uniref:tetratricopeptide repeat-containing glycosyltransferase n=1 Tax=Caulobacter sp. KR2-114 TaxID=3400912 RepID=UPI003BFB1D65